MSDEEVVTSDQDDPPYVDPFAPTETPDFDPKNDVVTDEETA